MSETFESNNTAGSEGASLPADPVNDQAAPATPAPWEWVPTADTTTVNPEAGSASGSGGQQPPPGYSPRGPAHWGYPGGGWGGPPSGPPPGAEPPRSHRFLRTIAVAGLLVASVGAGIGAGHALWPTTAPTPASASAPISSSGGSAAGNPFSGSGGGSPFSGSGGGSPFSGSGGGSPFSGSGGGSPLGEGSGSSSGTAGSGSPSDVSSIAAKVDPALVDINVTFNGQGRGAGTGIVLTPNGEVLTNNHVVEGATSISVTDIGNGKTYGATVVGYDRTDDVAVVQLTGASGLQSADIGNSLKVAVGDGVVAIGNAGGTGGTPTATGGSITALNQAITASDEVTGTSENLTGLLQTNANIQPGDSGGSLVNSSGQVIGMDTAALQGYSLSSQTNQGYAIPINKALAIASQIESGRGTATIHVGPTALLGVLVSPSNASAAPYPGGGYYSPFGGQSGSSTTTNGAVISGVVNGGPAATAGLSQGDVITSLGGHTVATAADLTTLIQQYKPGDRVQLGWTDTSGASHTATVTLGSGPAQ